MDVHYCEHSKISVNVVVEIGYIRGKTLLEKNL